jgi:predicted phosphate transport protein (TIGR00153 family)
MGIVEDLFRESPFEPIRHHMQSVMRCVDLVRPMFEAVRDRDYETLQGLAQKVFKAEHEADLIKDNIRQVTPTRFVLPVHRGDLLDYLKLQDDIADSVEDIAVLLTIKRLPVPPQLVDTALEFVDKVCAVCRDTMAISNYLPTLVEGDMVGRELAKIQDMIVAVEHREWEADVLQYRLSREMFALEDSMRPTDIFLWSHVFTELGQLANFAEKTSDRLRRMLPA